MSKKWERLKEADVAAYDFRQVNIYKGHVQEAEGGKSQRQSIHELSNHHRGGYKYDSAK